MPLLATSLCICCLCIVMVDETPLERLKRASLFTYEQVYVNVEYFCRSHGLAIVAADVFAEELVADLAATGRAAHFSCGAWLAGGGVTECS